MKRYISLALSAVMTFILAAPCAAQPCEHEYTAEVRAADCMEKEHTVYTCSLCGDEYKVYADEYSAPDDFYILCTTRRNGSRLKLRVYLYNNPGLRTGRMSVYYNKECLSPAYDSIDNGEIWNERDYTGGKYIDSSEDYFTAFTEAVTRNTSNGLYFETEFDVISDKNNYGIRLEYTDKSFCDINSETKDIIAFLPKVINIAGKNELGGHDLVLKETLTEPDFDVPGSAIYTCTVCGMSETAPLPPLKHWRKGDLNNDGRVDTRDSFLIKKYILQLGKITDLKYFEDAADVNSDGKIDMKDSYELRRILLWAE